MDELISYIEPKKVFMDELISHIEPKKVFMDELISYIEPKYEHSLLRAMLIKQALCMRYIINL